MMWRKSLFVFLFCLSTVKAEMDHETVKKMNGFISPSLHLKPTVVTKGQNVSIICSTQNNSLQITYYLFQHKKLIGMKDGEGKPVTFNLSISGADNLGPYKCKTKVGNSSRYSPEFNFTLADPVATPVLSVTKQANHSITLRCLSPNGSLPISYTFFEKDIAMSSVITKYAREPAEFHLAKSSGAGGEYRCKAGNRLPDRAKYSPAVIIPDTGGDSCPFCLQLLLPVFLLVLIPAILLLAFRILPKYKARKAVREKAPRDSGNTPMEVGLHANIYENQADKESVPGLEPRQCISTAQDETERSQEIHYVAPVFQKVTPQNHEVHNGKTEYVYSEINL